MDRLAAAPGSASRTKTDAAWRAIGAVTARERVHGRPWHRSFRTCSFIPAQVKQGSEHGPSLSMRLPAGEIRSGSRIHARPGTVASRFRKDSAPTVSPGQRYMIKPLLLLLFGGLKGAKLGTAGLSMLVSLALYARVWGWRYAAGFIASMFIHEMGHVIAARQRGLPVSAPAFIPFMGAFVTLRVAPHGSGNPRLMSRSAVRYWGRSRRSGFISPASGVTTGCCWRSPISGSW